ncbi:MAG: extracellular solute-binding protein [Chloroflexota bacterium]
MLTLWVAPAFAPDPATTAGALFSDRLKAFEADHAELQLVVRVKAEKGPGGLAESLSSASQAAPSALPDLATLDPEGVRIAAMAGHLISLQGLLPQPEPSEWYDFAFDATNVDGRFYALPFASDMEVFGYETGAFDSPPVDWASLFGDQTSFLIPAADPDALFLFAQYLALGGLPLDRAPLDPDLLAEALGFLASAGESGALAPASLEFTSSGETWLALQEGRAQAAQAPYAAFVAGYAPDSHAAGPLPTRDGKGVSLALSWSWVAIRSEQQAVAAELMAWLSDPAFLAEWTYSLGLVPSQPQVLARWPDSPEAAIASRLVPTALARPNSQVLEIAGPVLQTALRATLTGELTPPEAAGQAAEALAGLLP